MIYGARFFLLLVALAIVNGLVRFPIQKRDNREFIAAIANRAARGVK